MRVLKLIREGLSGSVDYHNFGAPSSILNRRSGHVKVPNRLGNSFNLKRDDILLDKIDEEADEKENKLISK